jgi:hypothetical protein
MWIPYNYNGDCAYANGFRVLAEATGVVILKTSATHSNISFLAVKNWVGWMSSVVWIV